MCIHFLILWSLSSLYIGTYYSNFRHNLSLTHPNFIISPVPSSLHTTLAFLSYITLTSTSFLLLFSLKLIIPSSITKTRYIYYDLLTLQYAQCGDCQNSLSRSLAYFLQLSASQFYLLSYFNFPSFHSSP